MLNGSREKTVVEPDTVLTALRDRIGWYHHNIKSVGPAICAKIQGISDFSRPDPLLHRTFGAMVATDRPERIDDKTLRSARGTNHRFEIAVHTMHPATATPWLAETEKLLDDARAVAIADRRAAHERWWAAFWDRSWIHITQNGRPRPASATRAFPPVNSLPLSIGMNSSGGSRLKGTFGRVGIYERVLSDGDIAALAAAGPQEKASIGGALLSNVPEARKALPEFADRTFVKGLSVEAWIRSDKGFAGDGRIVDKIAVGGANGFLLDTFPGNSLRLIVGDRQAGAKDVLKAGDWQHVAATASPSGESQAVRRWQASRPGHGRGDLHDHRRGRRAGCEPGLCAATVRQCLRGPRPLSDQVQRIDLHRARRGAPPLCRLSRVGPRLLVAEHAVALLLDAHLGRLRPDGAAAEHVCPGTDAIVQAPDAALSRP